MIGKMLSSIMQVLASIFQFIFFIIMQSGMNTILVTAGLNPLISHPVIFIVMVVLISSGVKHIIKINTILTPITIVGIVMLGVILISHDFGQIPASGVYFSSEIITPQSMGDIDVIKIFGTPTTSWLLSAILYVGFNALLVLPPLSEVGSTLNSKKGAIISGVLGGFTIGIMAMTTNIALEKYIGIVGSSEMPMLHLSSLLGRIPGALYKSIIFIAMMSSAVVAGFCTVNRVRNLIYSPFEHQTPLKKLFSRSSIISFVICIISIPLSLVNFSTLIAFFYPIFGIVGIFLVLAVLII